jgi:aspartate/methionine/tyrosine aminotransferase
MRTADHIDGLEISAVARILQTAAEQGWSDAIPMAGGEPRFPFPPEARSALLDAPDDALTKYSPFLGSERLLECIGEKLQRLNGVDLRERATIAVPGGSYALFATLSVLVDPGDEVLIPDPCWEHYPSVVRAARGHPRRFPMVQEGGRETPDLGALEAAVTPRTKAVLVNTPLNPSGAVLTRDEIEGLAGICDRYDLALIADEEYETFVYAGGSHVSPGAVYDRAICLYSFSKSFALTGIRLGYVSAPPEIVELLRRFGLYTYMFAPSPSQAMAQAVLESDYVPYLRAVRDEYERKASGLAAALDRLPGVDCRMPEGGVYVFPRIAGPDGESLGWSLIERAHVLCVPGEYAGARGRGHVRLFVGVPDEAIAAATDRIAALVSETSVSRPAALAR